MSAAREAAGSEEHLERDLRALLRAQRDGRGAEGATARQSATVSLWAAAPAEPTTADVADHLPPEDSESSMHTVAVGASSVRVLTVLDVPAYATTVDTTTGAVEWDETAMPRAPIAGEVFDAPEFASSAAGVEERTARLLRDCTASERR
ncbi:hypothetical protein [Streptomyces sp. NPDC045251]|uniref:hypothetical protein n=1 Tax=unclassified Streptomyces TaxID=2593676 RepID=UPI0033FEDE8B